MPVINISQDKIIDILRRNLHIYQTGLDIKDSNVRSVVNKYKRRSAVGIQKYGTTLDRDDLSFDEWLNHLQEELMDATLYIEKIRTELKKRIETMNIRE